ncbi:MAG: hypothetical protein HYX88_01125 [Chloroflexi bacterium]|nr:hypothetical protein [Chloroflexota bacterium]
MIVLVGNVGNRDLLLNGATITPAREEGERILQEFDRHADQLEMPILRPALDYVLRRSGKIDTVALFTTNQEDPRYRNSDTLFFGKVLKELVSRLYARKQVAEVRLFEVIQNPSLPDEMFGFFERQLKENKAFKAGNLEQIYVLPVGGTPASNMALVFQSIAIFREKAFPIYVSHQSYRVTPLNLTDQILQEFRRELIQHHLQASDYSAVAAMLNEAREPELWYLAHYAKHRLHFNADTALKYIDYLEKVTSGQERVFCQELRAQVEEIERGDLLALIREVYFNARIKYRQEEYVDFLGRVFRLQEAVLRYVVERKLAFSTALDKKTRTFKAFTEGVESNHVLHKFLEEKSYEGQRLKWHQVNIPTLMAVLEFLLLSSQEPSLSSSEREAYSESYRIFKKLKKLSELRDQSIIAHGFQGISRKIIAESYGEGDVIEDLSRVVAVLGIDAANDPFEKIKEHFLRKLALPRI